jgi:hypothetical protein
MRPTRQINLSGCRTGTWTRGMDSLGSTAKECRPDLSLAGLEPNCTNSSFTVLRNSPKNRPPSTNSAGVAPAYEARGLLFLPGEMHCKLARQSCLVMPSSPSALQQRIPFMLTISREASGPYATRWPRQSATGLHKRLEFLGVGTWSVSNSAAGWPASSCNVRWSRIMASPAINAQSGAS